MTQIQMKLHFYNLAQVFSNLCSRTLKIESNTGTLCLHTCKRQKTNETLLQDVMSIVQNNLPIKNYNATGNLTSTSTRSWTNGNQVQVQRTTALPIKIILELWI
jgi:hypothetical protein